MSSIPIAFAMPPSEEPNQPSSSVTIEEVKTNEKKPFFFADEIKINDQTVLTIPLDNMFYEEEKPKRKSRWGDRPEKKKIQQNVVFNPYAMLGQTPILPIGASSPPKETKKRVSKWGPEYEKILQPPLFHQIQKNVPIDEIEYLIRLYRLDEINRKITLCDYDLHDPDLRSPSPDPVYDQKTGVRTNTRENRAKENLMREKYDLIEEAMMLKKTFVPPPDYKPPKKSRKIYLPDSVYEPESNYIGMIIGPRGTTQKMLEQKSGCKISIRGKGSTKFKKTEMESDDKLHILLQADQDTDLDAGQQILEKILRGDIEETSELKKNQMLQLQAITGVLRDDYCENCHERGHRIWNCPNKLSWKPIEIKCSICGDRSHPTNDCPQKGKMGNFPNQNCAPPIENEFARFLHEVEGDNKAKKLLNLAASQVAPPPPPPTPQPNIGSSRLNFLTDNFNPVLQLTNGPSGKVEEMMSKTPLTAALIQKIQKGEYYDPPSSIQAPPPHMSGMQSMMPQQMGFMGPPPMHQMGMASMNFMGYPPTPPSIPPPPPNFMMNNGGMNNFFSMALKAAEGRPLPPQMNPNLNGQNGQNGQNGGYGYR